MPLIYSPYSQEFLYPYYLNMIYIPYMIFLQSEYFLSSQSIQNTTTFFGVQWTNFKLVLKSDHYLISDSTDDLLDKIHAGKIEKELKAQPDQKVYQSTGKTSEPKKCPHHQPKSFSCPCFSQLQPINLKKNQSMGFGGKISFFNAKKANNVNNELFMLLNLITARSDDILKQKLLNYIEKEGKCCEIIDSLIRRCLNAFSANEIRNINKVNVFLCLKSKECFAVEFIQKVKNLMEDEIAEKKEKAINMKNLLVLLNDVISEKVLKKREINEIIMRLLFNIIDLLQTEECSERRERLQQKIKFLVILVKFSFKKTLTEEILEKNSVEIMRKLNSFRRSDEFICKKKEKTQEVCEKFMNVFISQFSELSDV